MNESPPPRQQSRKLIIVLASIGVVLTLGLGIQAFLFLRAWKRGTLVEVQLIPLTNDVAEVNVPPPEVIPATPPQEMASPRKPRRPINDNFIDRIPLDTPAHVLTSNVGASNERGEYMQNTQI